MDIILTLCEGVLFFASFKKREFVFLLFPLTIFISYLEYRDKDNNEGLNLLQFSKQLGITFCALILFIDYFVGVFDIDYVF